MKILEVTKLEDCFDGSSTYGYVFDGAWTRDAIMRLRALGDVEYFAHFPRPYFRLTSFAGLRIKGVEGEDNCQVTFPRHRRERLQRRFEQQFGA